MESQKQTIPQDSEHRAPHSEQPPEANAMDSQGTSKDSQEKSSHDKVFEAWKEEVPEKPASYYKSPEEQFSDLHDRLTALVCRNLLLPCCRH